MHSFIFINEGVRKMEYYVYALIDPRTNMIFHVKDVRRGRIPTGSNIYLGRKIKNILNNGFKIKYKKLIITDNENCAYENEKRIIQEIGLNNLCNMTSGGDGGIPNKESRKKMSQSHKGKILSDEHKRKISEGLKGHTRSNETKKKMSESKKGKYNPNYGKK